MENRSKDFFQLLEKFSQTKLSTITNAYLSYWDNLLFPQSSFSVLAATLENPVCAKQAKAFAAASSRDASTVFPIPWKTAGGTVNRATWLVNGSDSVLYKKKTSK